MKTKNNFVSTVTIGHFNPSILTSDFLEKVCGLQLEGEPEEESKSPIVSRIRYSRIDFIADLDRLQIKEFGVGNPKDSDIAEYLRIYLEKLPYTPIFVSGINVNVDVLDLNEKGLITLLTKRREQLFEILETKDFSIEALLHHRAEGKEEYIKWNITYSIEEKEVLGRINLNKKESAIWRVNYNYEVMRLEKEYARLERITKHYPEIIKRYEKVMSNIFKEAQYGYLRA